jgi:hypothetical protein
VREQENVPKELRRVEATKEYVAHQYNDVLHKLMTTISSCLHLVLMTTLVAQSPSVTGSKELTTNQTKSNPPITWWKMKSFCQAKFVLLKLLLRPEIERNSKP